jgi:hypothetical protein
MRQRLQRARRREQDAVMWKRARNCPIRRDPSEETAQSGRPQYDDGAFHAATFSRRARAPIAKSVTS